MSSSSEECITPTAEERERIREQRCIDYFKDKGVVPCVCVFCGSVVVHRQNLKSTSVVADALSKGDSHFQTIFLHVCSVVYCFQ